MGCDIHSFAERRVGDKFQLITGEKYADGYSEPFGSRSYGVFAFLADVRNYSGITPISEQRGWPTDASAESNAEYQQWAGDAHSPSWINVSDLASFDYNQQMEDRRVTRQLGQNVWSGACTADHGEGHMTTYREFLGEWFFKDLQKLQDIGADRILFYFDN